MYVLFRCRIAFSTVKRTIVCSRMTEIENIFVMYLSNTCHIYMFHMGLIYIFVTYMSRIGVPYNVIDKYMSQMHVTHTCPIYVFVKYIAL